MSTLAAAGSSAPASSGSGIGTAVLVPLYVYPSTNAWQPLYDAIRANPSQKFNVIVNPDSGPGADRYPDANYIAGLQRLKSFPSVKTIGYVHMNYGSRNIKDVEKDINKYAGWASYSKTNPITVDGIFIDEAPSEYGTRNRNLNYIKTLSSRIYKAFDKPNKKAIVVMNPGVVAGNKFYTYVSSVVSYEDSISNFKDDGTLFRNTDKTKSTGVPKAKEAVLIHSYADSTRKMRELVQDLVENKRIGDLFLTSRNPSKGEDPYDGFGTFFAEFVKAMDQANVS